MGTVSSLTSGLSEREANDALNAHVSFLRSSGFGSNLGSSLEVQDFSRSQRERSFCAFSLPPSLPPPSDQLCCYLPFLLPQVCKGAPQHEEVCLGLFTMILTEPAQAQKVTRLPFWFV